MVEIYVDTGDSMWMIARIDEDKIEEFIALLSPEIQPHLYELVERVKTAYFSRLKRRFT